MSHDAREVLVTLDGVTCRYDAEPVLRDIDLAVRAGDYIGIVGPSGSGKTTLLRMLLGTMRAASGTVSRRPGVAVGYVPQLETVNWNFPVTVAECVLMARTGRWQLPWPTRAERGTVGDVLDRLGIGALAHRHIRELSGGQQQRMFIARALLRQPALLLLDEPSSGVDIATRHEMLHLLEDLHADGMAVVLTTHDLNGIAAHLPRIVCINGRVLADGAPLDVLKGDVLEATYGTQLDVLDHLGMRIVVDAYDGRYAKKGAS